MQLSTQNHSTQPQIAHFTQCQALLSPSIMLLFAKCYC